MDGTTLVVLIVGFSVAAVLAVLSLWISKRVKEARYWPIVESTIQSAEFDSVGNRLNAVDLPCFTFSYVVGKRQFSGRFALRATGDRGDSLIRAMVDKKMTIHYDPKRPQHWYIPVETIGGCEVEQKLSAKSDPLDPRD